MPRVPLLPYAKPKKPNPLLVNPCTEHSVGILSDVGTADAVNHRKISSRSPDSSLFAGSFSTSSSLTVATGSSPEAPTQPTKDKTHPDAASRHSLSSETLYRRRKSSSSPPFR
ncbi:hypothetical protein U1Q18_009242 [Sarracenia purpurea var. burkii]